MNTSIQSTDTIDVMNLARQNHWQFCVKEQVGAIDKPHYSDGWWYIPVNEDEKIIQAKAKTRIEAIKRYGIEYQELVMGHEAPKLLTAPPKEKEVIQVQVKEVENRPRVNGSFLPILLDLLLLCMGQAVLIDPAIFVVLKDGTWVEVMRWYE